MISSFGIIRNCPCYFSKLQLDVRRVFNYVHLKEHHKGADNSGELTHLSVKYLVSNNNLGWQLIDSPPHMLVTFYIIMEGCDNNDYDIL